MPQEPDSTKIANELLPALEASPYEKNAREDSRALDTSEKASVAECDAQDVAGANLGSFTSNHYVTNPTLVPEYSEEDYKKLRRKIDRYLLPLMWLCYGIQQTDKTSLGIQATFGLREVNCPL